MIRVIIIFFLLMLSGGNLMAQGVPKHLIDSLMTRTISLEDSIKYLEEFILPQAIKAKSDHLQELSNSKNTLDVERAKYLKNTKKLSENVKSKEIEFANIQQEVRNIKAEITALKEIKSQLLTNNKNSGNLNNNRSEEIKKIKQEVIGIKNRIKNIKEKGAKEIQDLSEGNAEIIKYLKEDYNADVEKINGESELNKELIERLEIRKQQLLDAGLDAGLLLDHGAYRDYFNAVASAKEILGKPFIKSDIDVCVKLLVGQKSKASNQQIATIQEYVRLLNSYAAITCECARKLSADSSINQWCSSFKDDAKKAMLAIIENKDVKDYPYLILELNRLRNEIDKRGEVAKNSKIKCPN